MGTKLNPQELELYRAVDEVLHYLWDPIGVSGAPSARDEYYSYVPSVFDLLRGGAANEAVVTYLTDVRVNRMGLRADPEKDVEIAAILSDWSQLVREKFA